MIPSDYGRPTSSRRALAGVALAWFVAIAWLFAWLLRTPVGALREQLKSLQFWSLELCFVLLLTLGAVVLRDLRRALERSDAIRMTTLAAAAVALTLFVAPRTNRIYYDEQIYQSIGQNLADLKLAQMCNDGTVEYGRLQCWSGEYNKQPYAYPHLLSVAYRALGVRESTSFWLNAAVMALTVCGVYVLVVILFSDRMAAFFAGLIVTLTPQQLLWSATAAVEPSASLACVGALVCAAHFVRSGTTPALAVTGVATAYAVQFRAESFLIVPVVGLLLWRHLEVEEFARPRIWWVGLLTFSLAAVHIAHIFAVRDEGWGTTAARLSLAYLPINLPANGGFYVGDGRFPVIFTVLSVLGLLARPFNAARLAIFTYFLSFFGMYLLFYAGSYNYGADVRYSLMTYPPLAVLGGLGVSRLAKWLEDSRRDVPAYVALTAGLAFQFLWYAPLVRATTEEAWAARADVQFARTLVPELKGNSYVLTHNPGMFHVWGVNAGQMSLVVTNPRHLDFLVTRYAGGVYLHWNFWCNVLDPIQREFCLKALEGQRAETLREYRERDQRYAFYRILGPPRQN